MQLIEAAVNRIFVGAIQIMNQKLLGLLFIVAHDFLYFKMLHVQYCLHSNDFLQFRQTKNTIVYF